MCKNKNGIRYLLAPAGIALLLGAGGAWAAGPIVQLGAATPVNASKSNAAAPPRTEGAAPLPAPEPRSSWSMKEMRLVPVQSGGRTKPLDSFARENVLFMTGSRTYKGWDPADLLLSWLTNPAAWHDQAFIQVGRADVRRQLMLDENRTLFSPSELFGNFVLMQYAKEMQQTETTGVEALSGKSDRGTKGSPQEQEMKSVFARLTTFRNLISGQGWNVVPRPNGAAWYSIAGSEPEGRDIRAAFLETVKAYQTGDEAHFADYAHILRTTVEAAIPGFEAEQGKIAAEVFYNKYRPFLIAWILYLASALAWIMVPRAEATKAGDTAKAPSGWRPRLAGGLIAAAVVAHVSGIAIRCYIAGRPPVTNMYESIIWVSLGVVGFATILYLIQRQRITLLVASVLATVGLIAADAAPAMIDPGLHPLVPVLRSNYWLTIHVLTITLGYAAFALTLGLANVTLFHFLQQARARAAGKPAEAAAIQPRIASMNLLTYRGMQFGVVLVAAGTILGGIWADYSWGRFWGWDPKEVWALITVLSYTAILHGRYTNWVGPFAFAAATVCGFLSVLMAWYGVNFVLGVGLHSYGFSSGGRGTVLAFTIAQLAYVAIVGIIYKKYVKPRSSKGPTATAPAGAGTLPAR